MILCLPLILRYEFAKKCMQILCQEQIIRSALGSSDFPKSLCFMWFWFGLEILRLVYKKAFLKIFYSILFELLTLKRQHRPFEELKKNLALISKMCRTLVSRSSQRFFLRKTMFSKKSLKIHFFVIFSPFCQTQDFCTFLKSGQNSASFDTLYAQFRFF